jgi:hypothetical protein
MALTFTILRYAVFAIQIILQFGGVFAAVAGAHNEVILASGKPGYENFSEASKSNYGVTQKHAGIAMALLMPFTIAGSLAYHFKNPITPSVPVLPIGRIPIKPPIPNANDAASASIIAGRQKILDNQAVEDAAIKLQRDTEDAARHNDVAIQLQHLDDVLAQRKAGT